PLLSYYSFFFYCYAAHLDLHSFPTRRSSDLVTFEPKWARNFESPSIASDESVGIIRFLMELEQPSPEVICAIQSAVTWLDEVKIDRKSTRLNSSHVKISYAVFCLKKKKQYIH